MHRAKFTHPTFRSIFLNQNFADSPFAEIFFWVDLQHIAVGVGVRLRACVETAFKIGKTKGKWKPRKGWKVHLCKQSATHGLGSHQGTRRGKSTSWKCQPVRDSQPHANHGRKWEMLMSWTHGQVQINTLSEGTWHGYDHPYHIILDLLNFCMESPCGSAHQVRFFFPWTILIFNTREIIP